jgi:hypothetical protein
VQQLYSNTLGRRAGGRLSNIEVFEMLREARAPDCVPEQLTALAGWIGYLASARDDAASRAASTAKRARPIPERIAAAAAELRRAIPEQLHRLEEEMAWADDDDVLQSGEREIARLKGMYAAVSIPEEAISDPEANQFLDHLHVAAFGKVDGKFPDNYLGDGESLVVYIPEIDPLRYSPGLVVFIFHLYEIIFGRSGFTRDAPAVRFLASAVKRIGWAPLTMGAIEQMLRRWIYRRELAFDRVLEDLEEGFAEVE